MTIKPQHAVLTLLVLLLSISAGYSQTARYYHFEGALSKKDNAPFSGTVDLEFKIYKTPRAEQAEWRETHRAVAVENGKFSVMLGSHTPLKLSFYEYYLDFTVSPEDVVTPPRRMIVGSGYNYRLWFLFAAYTIVWLAIFCYVLILGKKQRKISTELNALRHEAQEISA